MGAVNTTKALPHVPAGPIEITVRYRYGAYCAPRVAGRSASSTMSAQAAAELLADKLWGIGVTEYVRGDGPGVSVWRISQSPEVAR